MKKEQIEKAVEKIVDKGMDELTDLEAEELDAEIIRKAAKVITKVSEELEELADVVEQEEKV